MLMPPTGPVPESTTEQQVRQDREIEALWRKIRDMTGDVYAKVWVGASEPPEYETGTLWYDTADPTVEE